MRNAAWILVSLMDLVLLDGSLGTNVAVHYSSGDATAMEIVAIN